MITSIFFLTPSSREIFLSAGNIGDEIRSWCNLSSESLGEVSDEHNGMFEINLDSIVGFRYCGITVAGFISLVVIWELVIFLLLSSTWQSPGESTLKQTTNSYLLLHETCVVYDCVPKQFKIFTKVLFLKYKKLFNFNSTRHQKLYHVNKRQLFSYCFLRTTRHSMKQHLAMAT